MDINDEIEYKIPNFKNNCYISYTKKPIIITLYDVKIKNVNKMSNLQGFYLDFVINKDNIEYLSNIDIKTLELLKKNKDIWFKNNNLTDDDIDALYKTSYCKQNNIIKTILSNLSRTSYKINNIITDNDNDIINILNNAELLKKNIITLKIQNIGLYIYKETAYNKWLIKEIIINENENCDWDRDEIEEEWKEIVMNKIIKIDNEINEKKKLKEDILKTLNEIKNIKIPNNEWNDKINQLKNIII